jgi:hypothetical protein
MQANVGNDLSCMNVGGMGFSRRQTIMISLAAGTVKFVGIIYAFQ